MEPKPVYLIEQDDGALVVAEPPVADRAGRVIYCYQPPAGPAWLVDKTLALDLDTLRGVAVMAGAAEMVVLRRIEVPDLYFRRGLEYGQLRGADAGTLVLIRFDVHDSGAACEHWKF